jgi:Raf kinase inhibitor-like YbhB/YbcL family protein
MMRRTSICAMMASLAAVGLGGGRSLAQGTAQKITVESSAFKNGAAIPATYTADGKNVSPPISWSNLPAGTREIALILDDPDAPTQQPFVHWVIYKIPATAKGLPEGIAAGTKVEGGPAAGAIQGPNGFSAFLRGGGQPAPAGYRGPAPPAGKPHHYRFKVYALNAPLDPVEGLDKTALLKAMAGKIIGEGEIVGVYERKPKP